VTDPGGGPVPVPLVRLASRTTGPSPTKRKDHMAGSRGTKCSWIEMNRLAKEVLPAIERGEGQLYAQLRCVDPNTVSSWKRAAQVVAVLEDSDTQVVGFEHCDHQKYLYHDGKLLGSWVEENVSGRVRIVCRHCGKFYGYKPTVKDKPCKATTTSNEI